MPTTTKSILIVRDEQKRILEVWHDQLMDVVVLDPSGSGALRIGDTAYTVWTATTTKPPEWAAGALEQEEVSGPSPAPNLGDDNPNCDYCGTYVGYDLRTKAAPQLACDECDRPAKSN